MPNETPTIEHLEGGSERPLCHYGRSSEHPCWRAATEKYFREDEAPSLCPEHRRLVEVGHEEDNLRYALNTLEEWLKSKSVEGAPSGHLERHALLMRDRIVEEYARAAERTEAAELAANQGPPAGGEPRLTQEQSEELARLIIRADAFTNARTIVEDTPEDASHVFGVHGKWVVVAALAAAGELASEEVVRYKMGLGFED